MGSVRRTLTVSNIEEKDVLHSRASLLHYQKDRT